MDNNSLIPLERVERTIFILRGQKVILDADLARLYGVTTKRLNQQVSRNRNRFPDDFMFQLTSEEKPRWLQIVPTFQNSNFLMSFHMLYTEEGRRKIRFTAETAGSAENKNKSLILYIKTLANSVVNDYLF
jgi:hypothetical protein